MQIRNVRKRIKQLVRRVASISFASVVLFFTSPAQPKALNNPYSDSYALVIGISDYSGGWPPLAEAASDAERVADILHKQGFMVSLITNQDATKDAILRELQVELPKKLKPNDRFILYFAGHGQTISTATGIKQGFLVPHDGKIKENIDEPQTYISMSQIRDVTSMYLNSTHNLLVLDSCFSGLMMSRGLKLKSPSTSSMTPGTTVLTAGSHNQKSSDGVFTPIFIEAVGGAADQDNNGELSFSELSSYVKKKMKHLAPKQSPQFGQISGEGELALYPRLKPELKPIRRLGLRVAEPPRGLPSGKGHTVSAARPSLETPAPPPLVTLGNCKVRHSTRLARVFEGRLGGEFCGDVEGRFQKKNGLVEDHALQLQWAKISTKRVTHEEAEERCEDMDGGFRLPSLPELASLVQDNPTDEGYISAVFSDHNREWIWSSDFNSDEDVAGSIDFSQGDLHAEFKRNLRKFRCVRAAKR